MLDVQNFPLHWKSRGIRKEKLLAGGETAATLQGGSFVDYAVVLLHCLRIFLEKSYREALDLLSKMPQILAELGL